MTALVHFEAARRALVEAVQFDDVLKIKDVAEQAALYARQANDTELIEKATEIKVRAERRAGEMLRKARESGDLRGQGNPQLSTASTIGLEQIGITRDQSSRYQKLAEMPAEHFETAIESAKAAAGEVSTAFMLRQAKQAQKSMPSTIEPPEALREIEPPKPAKPASVSEVDQLRARVKELEASNAELRANLDETLADNESMAKSFEGDDRLGEALADAKKWRAEVMVLRQRVNGLMNEKNEAVRSAKSWQRKAEKVAHV